MQLLNNKTVVQNFVNFGSTQKFLAVHTSFAIQHSYASKCKQLK